MNLYPNQTIPQYFQRFYRLIEQRVQGWYESHGPYSPEKETVGIAGLTHSTYGQAFQNPIKMYGRPS